MPINGSIVTDLALLTDSVVTTVGNAAVIWIEYPFNLIIGIILFGVGFGVIRRVLHR